MGAIWAALAKPMWLLGGAVLGFLLGCYKNLGSGAGALIPQIDEIRERAIAYYVSGSQATDGTAREEANVEAAILLDRCETLLDDVVELSRGRISRTLQWILRTGDLETMTYVFKRAVTAPPHNEAFPPMASTSVLITQIKDASKPLRGALGRLALKAKQTAGGE